jgi:hypothetical protein
MEASMVRLISYVCAALAMVLGTVALSGNSIPLFLAFAAIELVFWKRLHGRRSA